MKKSIPRYTFYKHKYGSELLVDVVELKNIKKFLDINPVHTLTYYDITFVTEGSGSFSIDNQKYIFRNQFPIVSSNRYVILGMRSVCPPEMVTMC